MDGHPSSSKLDLFEGFTKKIVDMVQGFRLMPSDTAIFITFDEGGGYYDSGYVQPLDFFGDGTRIPMIVVSPYTTGGHIIAQLFAITFRSSNSSSGTGICDPSQTAAATISPTRSRNGEIHTCRSTVRRLAICSSFSILVPRPGIKAEATVVTAAVTN